MRYNFTNFHEISSEIVSFQIRSAPQFHQFSSKIAHFQIRNFVRNGQISNKERGVPCRSGRVADSLFRPHPEHRARASREPKHFFPTDECICTAVVFGSPAAAPRSFRARRLQWGATVARDAGGFAGRGWSRDGPVLLKDTSE